MVVPIKLSKVFWQEKAVLTDFIDKNMMINFTERYTC